MTNGMALATVLAALFCSTASAVTIEWASVGNPGNDADDTGYGRVGHAFRISKHEVTNGQYVEFLNAVDPNGQNSLQLYNPRMSSEATGGIVYDSAAGDGSRYKTKGGRGQNPVIYVSFRDAARFTNWLANGQGNATTESGAYVIGNGLTEVRDPDAKYFLPSEDEWYKAAYHKNDGRTGNYWDYPTSTDSRPFSDNPTDTDAPDLSNVANFNSFDGMANGYNDGFAVTGVMNVETTVNYLTNVGAYSRAVSPYGTFDQAGNVWEWVEGVSRGNDGILRRVLRGGSWDYHATAMRATIPGSADTTSLEDFNIGFRIASIPEPASGLLIAVVATSFPLLTRGSKMRLLR